MEERTSDARPVNVGVGVIEGIALERLEAALGRGRTSAEVEIWSFHFDPVDPGSASAAVAAGTEAASVGCHPFIVEQVV